MHGVERAVLARPDGRHMCRPGESHMCDSGQAACGLDM
jgi:hypothetical protein